MRRIRGGKRKNSNQHRQPASSSFLSHISQELVIGLVSVQNNFVGRQNSKGEQTQEKVEETSENPHVSQALRENTGDLKGKSVKKKK